MELFAAVRDAGVVLFDHSETYTLDALVGGEASLAVLALAAALDSVTTWRDAAICYLSVFFMAIGTVHRFPLSRVQNLLDVV